MRKAHFIFHKFLSYQERDPTPDYDHSLPFSKKEEPTKGHRVGTLEHTYQRINYGQDKWCMYFTESPTEIGRTERHPKRHLLNSLDLVDKGIHIQQISSYSFLETHNDLVKRSTVLSQKPWTSALTYTKSLGNF